MRYLPLAVSLVFDASGTPIGIWPNLRQPNDVFVSDDDKVWVVDGTNARLLQFDKNGKRLYWWGTYGMQPGQFWGAAPDLDR
jgi:hypothetical protein